MELMRAMSVQNENMAVLQHRAEMAEKHSAEARGGVVLFEPRFDFPLSSLLAPRSSLLYSLLPALSSLLAPLFSLL